MNCFYRGEWVATVVCSFVEGNDEIEDSIAKFINRLGSLLAQVDSDLFHYLYRKRM